MDFMERGAAFMIGGLGVAFAGAALAGLFCLVVYQMTGPCAFKGGVSTTAQDYAYCGNGARIDLSHRDDATTSTITIKSR